MTDQVWEKLSNVHLNLKGRPIIVKELRVKAAFSSKMVSHISYVAILVRQNVGMLVLLIILLRRWDCVEICPFLYEAHKDYLIRQVREDLD